MAAPYSLVRSRSSAGEFHARAVPVPATCEIWLHEITAPALVLGSAQRDDVVDHEACARAGVEVVRRRSGGGAVLLLPDDVVWLDVIIPRDAPGWAVDVHGPMRWLGAHLAAIVSSLVEPGVVTAHAGPMITTSWSSVVCFDGIGAGEVLIDGAKFVGISQRRTREAARLQCFWYSRYDPSELVDLLAADHRPPLADLAPVATVPSSVAQVIPGLLLARLNA